MQRFYSLTLAFFLIFTGSMIGVHTIGGLQPSPLAPLFINPEGMPCTPPCVFGIRPGETKGSAIVTHPLLRTFVSQDQNSGPIQEHYFIGPAGISVDIQEVELPDKTFLLQSITLSEYIHVAGANKGKGTSISPFLPGPVSVGDFLSLFGRPDAIRTVGDEYYFFFRSTKPVMVLRLKTSVNAPHLLATSPISDLALFDLDRCQVSVSEGYMPWLGFTTQKHYNQAQSIALPAVHQKSVSLTIDVPCPL